MKEKIFRIIFFIMIVFIIIFSIYYVTKKKKNLPIQLESKIQEEQIESTINIGITSIDVFDPILSKSQDVQYLSKLIYKPLIDLTEDFRLKEGLAEEWNKLDNKTYLIKLSDNIYWSNGEKVTSNDIKDTIEKIQKSESVYNNNVLNINEIEIIDDCFFKIHLKEEENNFEYLLCFPIVKENLDAFTGDFIITNIDSQEIVLTSRNKTLRVKIYEDLKDLYNAFAKEEIDLIITNNIGFKKYIGGIGYKIQLICGREFTYLEFNDTSKILSNKEVKKAISYAINKNEIIKNVYNNLYIQAEFPIQYGSYLYTGDILYEYNINKAQFFLENNDWVYNGKSWVKNKQELKLKFLAPESQFEVAKIIKKHLEILGISVDLITNNYSEKYDIRLKNETVSIKPEINGELLLKVGNNKIENNELAEFYKELNYNSQFIGLYFDSIILLYSDKMKGNLSGNWYNVFYNINTLYKVKE